MEIRFSWRRSISIVVTKDCKVVVDAPYGISRKEVNEFVDSKKNWIDKHIKKQEKVIKEAENLGYFSEEDIKNIKLKAKKVIPERVGYYAGVGKFSYNKIFIKLQKTRWGSCSADKNLNFNCLLVLMPQEVLDSVVVHELCHLKYMNHSDKFYKEIYKIFPDYDKWDKWLKDNGGIFLRRAVGK